MSDCVKKYQQRRDARVAARQKDVHEDDQWITMRGTHVLIDDGGQVSKGPETLKNVVKQGGGYKSKSERKYGSNAKYVKALSGGWSKPSPKWTDATEEERSLSPTEKRARFESYKKEMKKLIDEKGGLSKITNGDIKDLAGKIGASEKKMRDAYNYWYAGPGSKKLKEGSDDPSAEKSTLSDYAKKPTETMEGDFAKEGYKKNAEGRWEKGASNKEYSYGSGDERKTSSPKNASVGNKAQIGKLQEEAKSMWDAHMNDEIGEVEFEEKVREWAESIPLGSVITWGPERKYSVKKTEKGFEYRDTVFGKEYDLTDNLKQFTDRLMNNVSHDYNTHDWDECGVTISEGSGNKREKETTAGRKTGSNIEFGYGSVGERPKASERLAKDRYSKALEETNEPDGGNADKNYSGITPKPKTVSEKKQEPKKAESGVYDRMPFSLSFKGGGTPEERKQRRETVSRFINEAKEGDVYETGTGVGSSGSKFKVVKSRGKLALQWVGGRYSPVQMDRANVEKFIRNGAKLVK